jgi:hypothetical protein
MVVLRIRLLTAELQMGGDCVSKHICDEEFPVCPENAKAGKFYKLLVNNLSPTQLNRSVVPILNPAPTNPGDFLFLFLHVVNCVSVVVEEVHP